MKRKRTKRELERLAADFEGRMSWLETAWSCRTEYEIDLSSGRLWLKITMPGNSSALVIRCDITGVTVPGTSPDRRNPDSHDTNCPPDPRT
jgi:hypothetical protein